MPKTFNQFCNYCKKQNDQDESIKWCEYCGHTLTPAKMPPKNRQDLDMEISYQYLRQRKNLVASFNQFYRMPIAGMKPNSPEIILWFKKRIHELA